MPTPKKGPRLGGSPAHQRLMLANLASNLFEHGALTTTEAKARQLRPFAEKLITKAKRGDLHNRRQVLSVIRDKTVVRGHPLSDKQRAWALAASKGERYEAEEEYLNLVSEGRVPKGKPVALLVDQFPKPLKPPGRR